METTETRQLNLIPTLWSVVRLAHAEDTDEARQARQRLLERYLSAVRRYLRGALRDDEAADDLAQDFACRFLQGSLAGADESRGRFRDFVKGVLFNMIADHHKKKARAPRQLADDAPEPGAECPLAADLDAELLRGWRDGLLARAWEALKAQEEKARAPHYTVLRLRAERPELASPLLAAELGQRLGREVTAAGARKMLERAREAFSLLLVEEVAQGLESRSRRLVERELADLGLLEQCREAVARWQP